MTLFRYTERYAQLERLLDPSRNMTRYRRLLETAQREPPLVPFFPMLMKDLAFLHMGNKSKSEVSNALNPHSNSSYLWSLS